MTTVRWSPRLLLGSVLPGLLAAFSAQAQEPGTAREVWGLAPGVGYFLYQQRADGGYSIDGKPYDLVWSGLQLQLAGAFHWQFANHPFLAMGLDAAFMMAPNAKGADWDRTVQVDPDRLALGGYLAFSTCFRPNDRWRLGVHTGVGKDGISGALGFGGWGLVFGGAVHRVLGRSALATALGLRLSSMALRSGRDGMVRGESGYHVSLLFEALFEVGHDVVAHDKRDAVPENGRSRDQPW